MEKELINIRTESIKEKPFFQRAAKAHRCLVLADGFYEWKKEARRKQPYWITTAKKTPIAFAGLFAIRKLSRSGKEVPLFSIITEPANEFMREIHNRMPVILPAHKEKHWIESEGYLDYLSPHAQSLKAKQVSTAMNNARIDKPALISSQ
jgi:putative SOS response-associated peptidase YedK